MHYAVRPASVAAAAITAHCLEMRTLPLPDALQKLTYVLSCHSVSVTEKLSLAFPLLQSAEQIAVVPLNIRLGVLRIVLSCIA